MKNDNTIDRKVSLNQDTLVVYNKQTYVYLINLVFILSNGEQRVMQIKDAGSFFFKHQQPFVAYSGQA